MNDKLDDSRKKRLDELAQAAKSGGSAPKAGMVTSAAALPATGPSRGSLPPRAAAPEAPPAKAAATARSGRAAKAPAKRLSAAQQPATADDDDAGDVWYICKAVLSFSTPSNPQAWGAGR